MRWGLYHDYLGPLLDDDVDVDDLAMTSKMRERDGAEVEDDGVRCSGSATNKQQHTRYLTPMALSDRRDLSINFVQPNAKPWWA